MGRHVEFLIPSVMAGLVPAIRVLFIAAKKKDLDARERRQVYVVCARQTTMPGHDGQFAARGSAKAASRTWQAGFEPFEAECRRRARWGGGAVGRRK